MNNTLKTNEKILEDINPAEEVIHISEFISLMMYLLI